MKKIIKLENTINSNDIKGQEILTILEKINIGNNKDKKDNNLIEWYKQNGYFCIPLYNDFSSIIIQYFIKLICL